MMEFEKTDMQSIFFSKFAQNNAPQIPTENNRAKAKNVNSIVTVNF